MKEKLNIYWSPGFILGLFVLLINDHCLKSEFPHFITGKLSDLAGLFIFPIFFAAIFPKFRTHIYWITAIGFIFWKSSYSSYFIDEWNQLGIFNINRVVDYTDLFALIILPVSYCYFIQVKTNKIRVHPLPIILITAFAFIATSRTKHIYIGYQYKLPYGKNELIRRLNLLAAEDKQLPISIYTTNSNYSRLEGNDTVLYHIAGYKEFRDTFYNLKGGIDTVRTYQIPQTDTVYIHNNILYYEMDVKKYFAGDKKVDCTSVIAKLEITGDLSGSKIYLLGFNTSNCFGIFDQKSLPKELQRMQDVIEKKLNKSK
jgi:hypothetical protein